MQSQKTQNIQILNSKLSTIKSQIKNEIECIATDLINKYGISRKSAYYNIEQALRRNCVTEVLDEQFYYQINTLYCYPFNRR